MFRCCTDVLIGFNLHVGVWRAWKVTTLSLGFSLEIGLSFGESMNDAQQASGWHAAVN
jgi:hypothetical protein